MRVSVFVLWLLTAAAVSAQTRIIDGDTLEQDGIAYRLGVGRVVCLALPTQSGHSHGAQLRQCGFDKAVGNARERSVAR